MKKQTSAFFVSLIVSMLGVLLFSAPVYAEDYYDNGSVTYYDNGGATYYDNGEPTYYDNGTTYYDNGSPTYYDNGSGATYYDNGYGSTYYDNGYSNYPFDMGDYYPSPIGDTCGNACVYPTSSVYGSGGTQGWGYGYSPANYGYGGGYGYGSYSYPMYASAAYPMYQQPRAMQYQQPVQNYQMTWGTVTNAPVLYSKSIGTSVPLFGDYPSCVIYFLPTASPYTHALKWSGINIQQAMLTGYGQVTGEGYMEVPYDGREYTLTVWSQKGEKTTCSTK